MTSTVAFQSERRKFNPRYLDTFHHQMIIIEAPTKTEYFSSLKSDEKNKQSKWKKIFYFFEISN